MTRKIRILWQAVFLGLFLWLLARLSLGDPRAFPFGVFALANPLSAAGLAAAAGTIPRSLAFAGLLLIATLMFGRFACGWVCPLGTLQQLSSWLLSPRSRRESMAVNRWRSWYSLKYYLLAGLGAAAFAGSLQTGLLDPVSLLSRGLAAGLWPLLPGGRPVPGGWLAAALLAAVLLASRWIPRLFCRALCPLGALLGVFARFSLVRLEQREGSCTDCNSCRFACQGADEPLGAHRAAECMVCMNCLPACPERALSFRLLGRPSRAPESPDLRRRYLVGSFLAGLAIAPVLAAAGGGRRSARPKSDPPPWLPRRVRVPFPVREVPAVRPGLPDRGHPASTGAGGDGGVLDTGGGPEAWTLRVCVHAVRRGLPDPSHRPTAGLAQDRL